MEDSMKDSPYNSINLYDAAVAKKIQLWLGDERKVRVLKPEETTRFYQLVSEEKKDGKVELPAVMLSRDKDIELLLNIKNPKSFDGKTLINNDDYTLKSNVIPIKIEYQLNIFTKEMNQGLNYVRELVFKLINNPTFEIEIPDRELNLRFRTNMRVLSTISDISETSERVFPGQFTVWSLRIELQDAHFFSFPLKNNFKIDGISVQIENKNNEWDEIFYVDVDEARKSKEEKD